MTAGSEGGRITAAALKKYVPVMPGFSWSMHNIGTSNFPNTASIGLANLIQVPHLFNPAVIVVSFVFSAGTGVPFGYLPARRAARMDLIGVLRHK